MNPEQRKQFIDLQSAGSEQDHNGQVQESSNGEPHLGKRRWLEEQLASDVFASFDLHSPEGRGLAGEQLALLGLATELRKQCAEADKAQSEAAITRHQEQAESGRLKVRTWELVYLCIIVLAAVIGAGLVICALIRNDALLGLGGTTLLTSSTASGVILSKAQAKAKFASKPEALGPDSS